MRQYTRGFTLVELLLAMGIFTILMTVLMQLFTQVVEMRLAAEADSSLTQDAQYVSSRLTYDISRATAIGTPANPGDSGSSLTLTIEGESYTYAVTGGGQLTLTTPSGSDSLTGSGTRVPNLTFVRRGDITGAQTVTFDLTLQSVIERSDGPATRTIHGTGGTR